MYFHRAADTTQVPGARVSGFVSCGEKNTQRRGAKSKKEQKRKQETDASYTGAVWCKWETRKL